MSSQVVLAVYDLSMGMAAQMSQAILGKKIDYIPHTGVRVFGYEYFFGGGIQRLPPQVVQSTFQMQPIQLLPLGETSVSEAEFQTFLRSINSRFTEATYDLFEHNCNNFSDEAAKFLLGKGIPSEIIDLPSQVLATPMGQMIRPMLSQQSQTMNNQLSSAGGTSLFSESQGQASAAVASSSGQQQAASEAASDPAPKAEPFTFSGPSISITIKSNSISGGRVNVDVPANGTVGEAKQAIAAATGITMEQQKLIFMGKILGDNAATIAGVGVKAGLVVHLVVAKGVQKEGAGSSAKGSSATSVGVNIPSGLFGNDALATALLKMNGHSKEKAKSMLRTIAKVCDNIISHPHEAKYRKLKLSNARFQERVVSVPGGMDLLKAIGFKEQNEEGNVCYVLVPSKEAWEVLTDAKRRIERCHSHISGNDSAPGASASANAGAGPFPSLFGQGLQGMGAPGMFGGPSGLSPENIMGMMSNPAMQHAMQAALQNPAMLTQMMSNPMIQQAMQANPQLRQAAEALQANPAEHLQNIARMQQAMGANAGNQYHGMNTNSQGRNAAPSSNSEDSSADAAMLAAAIARSLQEQ